MHAKDRSRPAVFVLFVGEGRCRDPRCRHTLSELEPPHNAEKEQRLNGA